MNVDVAQRKGNVALVSKRIKLVPEQGSLGLPFSHFVALKESLGRAMQSWATL